MFIDSVIARTKTIGGPPGLCFALLEGVVPWLFFTSSTGTPHHGSMLIGSSYILSPPELLAGSDDITSILHVLSNTSYEVSFSFWGLASICWPSLIITHEYSTADKTDPQIALAWLRMSFDCPVYYVLHRRGTTTSRSTSFFVSSHQNQRPIPSMIRSTPKRSASAPLWNSSRVRRRTSGSGVTWSQSRP